MQNPTAIVRSRAATAKLTRVECIDDLRSFAELRPAWNELLQASRSDCPFLTWEWLHAWWTHLHGERSLRLLCVRAGDDVIGLAPLSVRRGTFKWFSRLEFLGTGCAGSDYLDVIVRCDHEAEGVAALTRALASHKLALHLDHLRPASLASGLIGPLVDEGWTSLEAPAGVCPFIRLAGQSWESYLGTVGPAHRANCRRRFKAITRRFQMRFEQAASEPQRLEILGTLMALHNRRWDTRGGSTAFATPALRAFHDEVTRRALERGWLRLYLLRLDEVPAAAMYCFAYGGRFYFYQSAFDERFSQYSIGLVMMGLTIRAAIQEGAFEFDMLYGNESYKWLWARKMRALARLDLFPTHVGGRIHHRTVAAQRTVRTLARRILSRQYPCNPPIDGVA